MTSEEAARFEEIIAALSEVRGKMYPNARRFLDDQIQRYEEHGMDVNLSGPQWKWLEDLYTQFA